MCLYIPATTRPTILSESITVYKLLLTNNLSFFRHFKYEKNKKVSVEISIIKPEENTYLDFAYKVCPEGYMPVLPTIDDIEYTKIYLWILKNSLYYKSPALPNPTINQLPSFIKKNTILEINSGLHFFYTLKRAKQYILNAEIVVKSRIGVFEIPAGSTVYTGIDDSLGVTDNIILKRTFLTEKILISI